MGKYAHKGQILPLVNQMIPISKDTTFHASYDYGLHGFNQGKVVAPQGQDRSLDFSDGSFIRINPSERLDMFTEQTISAWIYPTVASGTYGPIVCKWDWDIGNYRSYELIVANTGELTYAVSSSGADTGATSVKTMDYPKNQWVHVAATHSSSGTIAIYVNGVLKASTAHTGGIFSTNRDLLIASFRSGTFGNWKGKISEVGLWGRALGAGEIKSLSSQPANTSDPELRGYWKLNESEGPIAFDHSGSGNDGTWNGGIASAYGPTVVSKVEGKFRKGVLIEPDSENLAPYTDYSNRVYGQNYTATSWSGDAATVAYYAGGGYGGLPYRKMHKDGGGTGGSYIDDHSTFSLVDGKTYTVSAWMKADGPVVLNGYAIALNRGADNKYIAMGDYPLTTEWQRFSYTFTTVAGDAGDWKNRSIVYIDEDLPIEIYWCGFQVEERDCPTSFVKGLRPLGKLWYPKELVNPSAFTISFWFNIPYMHRNSSSNGGIQGNWYHPIVEIATPTSSSQSFGIVAGPEPTSWNRRIQIQQPSSGYGMAIEDDTWYHMTATYDGSVYKLYIDGVETASATAAPMAMADGQVLMIGGGYQGKPNIKIDEVRIESRAISIEEVQAWAASGLHYNYLDYSMIAD